MKGANKMKRSITLWLMAALLAVSCSEPADGTNGDKDIDGAGLTIQSAATIYNWSDKDFSSNRRVIATISNISSNSYYSVIGDRFNSSLDQETLFVAKGSDGYLEISIGYGAWSSLERTMLIEGVGTVILRPGKQYELLVLLPGTDQPTGTFRFKINYSTQNGGTGGQTFTDYSNTFVIK